MTEYVYRFRSIASLFGEHQELENQEIYFSTLEQLNDPMEGFTDLFWSGDKIVWMNLLVPGVTDLSEPSTRKFRYRFSDLKGIIFGINTSEKGKLAIIRVIQEKCKKEIRKEFEFHQAYYAKATGRINAAPLSVINFKS